MYFIPHQRLKYRVTEVLSVNVFEQITDNHRPGAAIEVQALAGRHCLLS